jgi:hypothetical protein
MPFPMLVTGFWAKELIHSMEDKSLADEKKTAFEKYSTTERFEDILNTLKGFYLKLEMLEYKKETPAPDFINILREQRFELNDIQQKRIKYISIDMMEKLMKNNLLPQLQFLQKNYGDI